MKERALSSRGGEKRGNPFEKKKGKEKLNKKERTSSHARGDKRGIRTKVKKEKKRGSEQKEKKIFFLKKSAGGMVGHIGGEEKTQKRITWFLPHQKGGSFPVAESMELHRWKKSLKLW